MLLGNTRASQSDPSEFSRRPRSSQRSTCRVRVRNRTRDGPQAAFANQSPNQSASKAICASKSARVRCINSLKRSLVLCSNCWTTRLRDSNRSAFLMWFCVCSALSARLAFEGFVERDASICASTDLLSQPRAISLIIGHAPSSHRAIPLIKSVLLQPKWHSRAAHGDKAGGERPRRATNLTGSWEARA